MSLPPKDAYFSVTGDLLHSCETIFESTMDQDTRTGHPAGGYPPHDEGFNDKTYQTRNSRNRNRQHDPVHLPYLLCEELHGVQLTKGFLQGEAGRDVQGMQGTVLRGHSLRDAGPVILTWLSGNVSVLFLFHAKPDGFLCYGPEYSGSQVYFPALLTPDKT